LLALSTKGSLFRRTFSVRRPQLSWVAGARSTRLSRAACEMRLNGELRLAPATQARISKTAPRAAIVWTRMPSSRCRHVTSRSVA